MPWWIKKKLLSAFMSTIIIISNIFCVMRHLYTEYSNCSQANI